MKFESKYKTIYISALTTLYVIFICSLIFDLKDLPADIIFSIYGFGITLVIVLLSIPIIISLSHQKYKLSDFGAFLLFGVIGLFILSWISNVTKINKLTETFYNYKGVVTRKSDETSTQYTQRTSPYGNDVDEREVYTHKPSFNEVYKISENIDNVISTYLQNNSFVMTEKFIFWQVSFLNGFKVAKEKEVFINNNYFVFVAIILFVLESFIKMLPLTILIGLITLLSILFYFFKQRLIKTK